MKTAIAALVVLLAVGVGAFGFVGVSTGDEAPSARLDDGSAEHAVARSPRGGSGVPAVADRTPAAEDMTEATAVEEAATSAARTEAGDPDVASRTVTQPDQLPLQTAALSDADKVQTAGTRAAPARSSAAADHEEASESELARSAAVTLEDPTVEREDRPDRSSREWRRRIRRERERAREREWDRKLANWTRPEGPIRIALQAGHWKAAEAPDEQDGLRNNGTRGGGLAEWEVNLGIARKTAALLKEQGYQVEILPTTIPPAYWADVFVSIHADGSASPSASGFRAAAPRRDRTGRAHSLAALLTTTYAEATGLRQYPTITRRMRSYYAFNYRRYEHSLHPMTVGVILETGFLTSPHDRRIIVDDQERAARGIAEAIVRFVSADTMGF